MFTVRFGRDGLCPVRFHVARGDTRPPARQVTPDIRQPPLGRNGVRPSRSFLCVSTLRQKTEGWTRPPASVLRRVWTRALPHDRRHPTSDSRHSVATGCDPPALSSASLRLCVRQKTEGGTGPPRIRSAARVDTRPPARQATPDIRQPPLGRNEARPSRSFLRIVSSVFHLLAEMEFCGILVLVRRL